MTPKTELLLYDLLRIAELFLRPTLGSASQTKEQWAARSGNLRRIRELEAQRFIEIQREPGSCERVVRLTASGRERALGGRDPEKCWGRSWDGLWRFVSFDLPSRKMALRQQLWRFLTERHFGWLQRSVWLSPDPGIEVKELLAGLPDASDVLVCIEGRTTAGETDAGLVKSAWNFPEINRRYERYVEALVIEVPDERREFAAWMERERDAWLYAIEVDPFLPAVLHPKGYLGPHAWQKKQKAFRKLGKFLNDDFLSQL